MGKYRIHSKAPLMDRHRSYWKTNIRNSEDYSLLECDAVFSGRSMLNLVTICNIANGHDHHHEN
jgi:hypothetical protein